MNEDLMIVMNEDGVAELYNPEWDITIHCESEKDHNRCVEILQNAYKYKWNSINDKLPEPDNYILLSFENFSILDIGRYEIDKNGDGAFYPGDDDVSYISHGLIVNAWMPLPEPYREE